MKRRKTNQNRPWIEGARKLLRWLSWLVLMFLSLFIVVYLFGGRPMGVLQAKFDIWQGNYEIHGYGYRLGISRETEMLAHYGIVYRHVAGCMINQFIKKSTAAYNATMKRAIQQDLGLDVDNLTSAAKGKSIRLIPQ